MSTITKQQKQTTDTNAVEKAGLWDDIRSAARQAIVSKAFIGLTLLGFIEMIVVVIIAIASSHPGLAIKTHCEVMAGTDIATDCTSANAPWFYVYNFAVLPLVVFVCNTLVALKLLAVKGRTLALCWLWLSLLVGLVVSVLGLAMIGHFM